MRYGLTSFILILSALFQVMDTSTAESSDSTGIAFSIFKVFTCGNVDSCKRINRVKNIKHAIYIYIYKQILFSSQREIKWINSDVQFDKIEIGLFVLFLICQPDI